MKLLYVDAICRNVDRHSGNFGILRDPDTGEAIRLAPNYDNNIALFARLSGTASISAKKDMLITDFLDLIEQRTLLLNCRSFPGGRFRSWPKAFR